MTSSEATVSAYAFRQLEAAGARGHGARDILSTALAEAEELREQARRQGAEEGRSAGLVAGRAEVEMALASLDQALAEVEAVRRELVEALEVDASELAFALAEHILAGALAVQPERILDVARNALRRVSDRRRVTLVVHPADLEILAESVERLKSELGGIEQCEVQADRRIDRGGAILRTDAGEIDVTIDSQLERAREIVAGVLKEQ